MTLYIFDKDGTLVAGVPKADGKTRPANKPEEQILLLGVARKICQLRSQGHLIAIASNQGGCAWGVMTTNYEKMPVVFVGDQESDRQAAAAAGVEFVWAQDFFCYE